MRPLQLVARRPLLRLRSRAGPGTAWTVAPTASAVTTCYLLSWGIRVSYNMMEQQQQAPDKDAQGQGQGLWARTTITDPPQAHHDEAAAALRIMVREYGRGDPHEELVLGREHQLGHLPVPGWRRS